MLRAADGRPRGVVEMANQMGKRYACGECEATVLVTKPGDGELSCHGKAMELAQAKPLPSSD
jgi:Desulfoferrodoxin, N-terminal domain